MFVTRQIASVNNRSKGILPGCIKHHALATARESAENQARYEAPTSVNPLILTVETLWCNSHRRLWKSIF